MNVNMGFWAWLIYSHAYLVATFISPLYLVLWQNVYLIHGLFVIQEIADTLGLILLLIFMLLTHLLVRNSMFCLFTNNTTVLQTSSQNKNHLQSLKILSSSYNHVLSLTQTSLSKLLCFIRQ